jgi:hypothetical protein
VRQGALYGFIDAQGKAVVPIKYTADIQQLDEVDVEFFQSFENGVALVNIGEKIGYIDVNGREYFND